MKLLLKITLFVCILLCLMCDNADQKTVESFVMPPVDTTAISTDTIHEITKAIPKIDYDTTLWTEILYLDTSIQVDMKYATTDNFVAEKMYPCSRCFLRPEVAKAVVKAQGLLNKKGYGLKMLDCYRPRPIQQKLWDKVPNPSYVTPPGKGSMHNRGSAVDLTLVDENGKELDMGTPFDFFGKEAHQDYEDLPEEILQRRELLRETMRKVSLYPIRTEWWHYYYAPGAPTGHELSDMIWKCDGH